MPLDGLGRLSARTLVAVPICEEFSNQDETLLLMKSDQQPITLVDKVLLRFSVGLSLFFVLMAGKIWGQEPKKEGWIKWMILFSVGVLMPLAAKLFSKWGFPHHALMAQGAITLGVLSCMIRPAGLEAAGLACAWLFITSVSAVVALWQARRFRELKVSQGLLARSACFSSRRCRVAGGLLRRMGTLGIQSADRAAHGGAFSSCRIHFTTHRRAECSG